MPDNYYSTAFLSPYILPSSIYKIFYRFSASDFLYAAYSTAILIYCNASSASNCFYFTPYSFIFAS